MTATLPARDQSRPAMPDAVAEQLMRLALQEITSELQDERQRLRLLETRPAEAWVMAGMGPSS